MTVFADYWWQQRQQDYSRMPSMAVSADGIMANQ
jgi:hypothetical protein